MEKKSIKEWIEDDENQGIPFKYVEELFNFLTYGSALSVAVRILKETGCRISELDLMHPEMIKEGWIHWQCGKNQQSKQRKEKLSEKTLEELKFHRENCPVPKGKLFGANHKSLMRYFRRDIRPKLSSAWNEKQLHINKGMQENHLYKLELKGFRKNFASVIFAYYWKKYDDANLAAVMTCKRMRHSNTNITATHYIRSYENLGLKNRIVLPFEEYNFVGQTKIWEFNKNNLVNIT